MFPPPLAENFFSLHEQFGNDQFPTKIEPVSYRRYVDGTFNLFKSMDKAPLLLDFLKRQHLSFKLTAEQIKDMFW